MDALRLAGIHFGYDDRPVLDGVDLAVRQRDLAVLQGRSGSGKSTLLSIAAGLVAPNRGQVILNGRVLPGPDKTAAIRARHIGLVFQHLNLLDELSVRENIELPLRLQHRPRAEVRATSAQLIERFGLDALKDRRPTKLSGGEQQRVAIARALAPRPTVLLVDEPTSSLDRDNALTVIQALEAAAQAGAAVLVAAHDELLTDRPGTYRIEQGRIWRKDGV